MLGRAEFKANVHFDGRNAFLDEAVLIAANEAVAQRLGIGDGLHAHGLRDGHRAWAKVRFVDALNRQDFQRHDGEKHVHVDVGNDGLQRNGGMRGEIF